MKKLVFSFALLAMSPIFSNAQNLSIPSLDEAKKFTVDIPADLEPNAVMDFYYGVKGEEPEDGYPVFLYLHGSGPRDQEWASGLKLGLRFDDAPSLYAIPRIPNQGEYYRWWQKGKIYVWNKLIKDYLNNENIDPSRIYLFGISEGGYGSQRLASYYADYLAAAGPMAGGEPLKNAPVENLSNIAFSFLTGEKDRMFYRNELTANTAHCLDSMSTRYPEQYLHRIELIPNMGHSIDYTRTTPWLKQYRRNAQPKSFRWENFEMDGIKRNNFYNLEVLAEEPCFRTYYDFKVEDNTIDLIVEKCEYETTYTDKNWGIPLYFHRNLERANHGNLRIYLSEQLINLNKKVCVNVNGKRVFKGKVKCSVDAQARSKELWSDPLRIFPTYIEIEW